MYLDKDHMKDVEDIISDKVKEFIAGGLDKKYIDKYVVSQLGFIIKDFQKFVTDLQEQVKPQ